MGRRKTAKSWRKRVMKGCSRKMRKNRKLKGGSLVNFVPSDFLNMSNYGAYNAGGLYNGYFGYAQPVNPLPWAQ